VPAFAQQNVVVAVYSTFTTLDPTTRTTPCRKRSSSRSTKGCSVSTRT
jgi:hypothetical protein